jgi:hypothetical protein
VIHDEAETTIVHPEVQSRRGAAGEVIGSIPVREAMLSSGRVPDLLQFLLANRAHESAGR